MKPKRIMLSTPQDAEAAFYEAFEKADLDAMMAVWADDDEIVCVHPGGPRIHGVAQVREAWRQVFANANVHWHIQLVQRHVITGVSLAMHSVYEQLSIVGEPHQIAPLIATNVYQRTARGWRIVVHHASVVPETPTDPLHEITILH